MSQYEFKHYSSVRPVSWFVFRVLLCVWFTACFPSVLNYLKGAGSIPGQFINNLLSLNWSSDSCFSPSTSGFPCQYHCNSAPYLFICHFRCMILASDSVFKLTHTHKPNVDMLGCFKQGSYNKTWHSFLEDLDIWPLKADGRHLYMPPQY
jgi:hypothetical protein